MKQWGLRFVWVSLLPPGMSLTLLLAFHPFLWVGRALICSLRLGTQHGHRAALMHTATLGTGGGLGGSEALGVALSGGVTCYAVQGHSCCLPTPPSAVFSLSLKAGRL